MSSKHLTVYYRLPVIGLCALIFWQSSFPSAISTPLFAHDDKVFHFITYVVLAFLAARNLKKEKSAWSIQKIVLSAIVFSALYGLSDEIHQAFVPARHASFFDFLADGTGSLCGGLIFTLFIKKLRVI